MGKIYNNLGNYTKAISYYDSAMAIHAEMEHKLEISSDLTNLGNVYINLGDYPKAISHYDSALAVNTEIAYRNGISSNLTNLGIVYMYLVDYYKAISYYEQALAIDKEIVDKQGIANDLTNLGMVYVYLGDYAKSISYFEQARAIKSEIRLPTSIEEINLAEIWLKTGEIEKAEQTLRKLDDPIRLGNLNLVQKNFVEAISYFNKSLERDLQQRDADLLLADYVGLGKAYHGINDLNQAKVNYQQAITIVEEQRARLAACEKIRFYAAQVMNFKRTEPYEDLVAVLWRMNDLREAFFYSENLKARFLTEAISNMHSLQEASLPSNWAQEENDYINEIWLLTNQIEAFYIIQAMDIYYEKEAELNQIKADQQGFIARLREAYPEYAAIHYPQPIKPQQVLLNPDEALIEFEVTDNATLVFMLAKDQLKTRRIDIARDSLNQFVLNYRSYFENIRQTSQLGKYDPKKGNQLYALLFGDLLKAMTEGTTLIIVADEFLGILPFEALVDSLPAEEKYGDSEFGPFPLGVRYLGDKYPISYAQSATSLTLLRTLKKSGGTGQQMLVVADPIFSANDSRLSALVQAKMSDDKISLMGAIVDWKQTKQMGVEGVRSRDEGQAATVDAAAVFPRLEKTTMMAQTFQSLFGKNAMVFSGSEASEEKIQATDLSQYRYLTFATHGILDNTVPYIREPALVLSQVGNPDSVDGFLTMSEVMGLKLAAEVVALTACETGLGKNVSGEGVMGMGRAFQYAGAQNVLVSLWSVAETSATELTAAFFKYVKQGIEPKEAIRLARNEIRAKGYEHPFYWASFILFGK